MTQAFNELPRFDQLPIERTLPPESAWGVFGPQDELGCLNLLSPEGVVEAARLVRSGKIFRLDAKIGFAEPPLFQRAQVIHRHVRLGGHVQDDLIDNYNTQEGSQWDGFAHMDHQVHGKFYGGVGPEQIGCAPGGRLSIHHWADKFVGRGLLVDLFGYRQRHGIAVDPLGDDCYSLAELEAAIAEQGSRILPGTILLLRTGWMESYAACTPKQRREIAEQPMPTVIGIEPTREMAAWLWDNRVAAIGADNTSVEPLPMRGGGGESLHEKTLAPLGLPLGELLVLAPLAADCADDGRYDFMMVSAPMPLEGGVASPANALAIK